MKQVAEFDLTVMVGKQNRGSERADMKVVISLFYFLPPPPPLQLVEH